MKTILFLFCIFLPAMLFGQTWQQAVDKALGQSAKKASISLQKSKTRLKALNQTLEKEAHMRKVLDSYYAPVTPYSISNVYQTLAVAWAGASNKLNIIHRIIRERQLNFLRKNDQKLQTEISVLPFSQAADMARRIGPDTQYVFLGEEHYLEQSRTLVLQVLQNYQLRYPGKKIIFLTENVRDSGLSGVEVFSKKGAEAEYSPLMRKISARGIIVAGLEENPKTDTFYVQNEHLIKGAVASQGIQVRNLHWAKRIKEWRAKYPHAVFFIYTGANHCVYDMPSSLPNLLGAQKTYVSIMQTARSLPLSFFHAWTKFKYANPGLLLFKNKTWARHIGFDEQIIFPQ